MSYLEKDTLAEITRCAKAALLSAASDLSDTASPHVMAERLTQLRRAAKRINAIADLAETMRR